MYVQPAMQSARLGKCNSLIIVSLETCTCELFVFMRWQEKIDLVPGLPHVRQRKVGGDPSWYTFTSDVVARAYRIYQLRKVQFDATYMQTAK